jgi:hypothetical protein
MLLKDCTYGTLVFAQDCDLHSPYYEKPKRETYKSSTTPVTKVSYYIKVGIIVGLSLNCTMETIVIVKWNGGQEYSIHPGNLLPFNQEEYLNSFKEKP